MASISVHQPNERKAGLIMQIKWKRYQGRDNPHKAGAIV